MTGRTSPVTLTSTTGLSVKCAANKRFALTAHERDVRTGAVRLVVIFRTNDQAAAIQRGAREGRKRTAAVGFYSLDTGRLLGHWDGAGTFRQAHPVNGQEARK